MIFEPLIILLLFITFAHDLRFEIFNLIKKIELFFKLQKLVNFGYARSSNPLVGNSKKIRALL
tara:strand:- start:59 stop:247 length:189 start_codon:yes stop_codon:yes gene_type:complete